MTQLSLLPAFDEDVAEPNNYWLDNFNWKPEIKAIARINKTIAYCKTLNRDAYCCWMQVSILNITGDDIIVETTKEWQEQCIISNASGNVNEAGNIWYLKNNELSPNL